MLSFKLQVGPNTSEIKLPGSRTNTRLTATGELEVDMFSFYSYTTDSFEAPLLTKETMSFFLEHAGQEISTDNNRLFEAILACAQWSEKPINKCN